jgi:FlaG/FlaF family flagellin (archaellin)
MRTNRDIKRMIANRENGASTLKGASSTNLDNLQDISNVNQVGNAAYATTNDGENMKKIKVLAAQDKKTIEEQ